MAGIDKTYIKTYNQYKEVCDWCKDIVVTFNNTIVKNVSFKPFDFIYKYTEDDFNRLPENGELVLWNTPWYMDKWLIKNSVDFGFILRAPKGKEEKTNIDFDSTLFRYVGTNNAKKMRMLSMCLEEYRSYVKVS